MLEIKKHFSPYPLKNQWKNLENEGIGIYQSYYVQKMIFKRLPIYSIKGKYHAVYYEVVDNGKTVMIAPLCRFNKTNNYSIIGLFNGLQVYDFVYNHSVPVEKINEYVIFLLRSIDFVSLSIKNMISSSLVLEAIKRVNGLVLDEEQSENVSILIGNNYDEYFGKLSKHTRQNIRTAYNRIIRDNINIDFNECIDQKINRQELNELIDLYCDRHEKRYGVYSSKYKRFYLKYFDFSTLCQQNYHNYYAILKFNNTNAAFLSGLIDKNSHSIIVPRLSINDEFLKYSPGMILINETAKKISDYCDIDYLDLSKGNEKYKLSMGGKIYYTVNFSINRRINEG